MRNTCTSRFSCSKVNRKSGPFSRSKGTLLGNEITDGKTDGDFINQVTTYTGQAFKIPKDAKSIIQFSAGDYLLLPDTAWRFQPKTPKIDIQGWAQGAYSTVGKGKLVVFGEAAMFSA